MVQGCGIASTKVQQVLSGCGWTRRADERPVRAHEVCIGTKRFQALVAVFLRTQDLPSTIGKKPFVKKTAYMASRSLVGCSGLN